MKYFFLPLALCWALSSAAQSPAAEPTLSDAGAVRADAAAPVFPAASPAIRYTGRIARAGDGSVSFDWPGVYAELRFTGPELTMRVGDTGHSYYNLTIDGRSAGVVETFGRDSLVRLASGLSEGEHTLRLQKRTEAREGRTTIHAFLAAPGGTLLPSEVRRTRHIEFIGDSYTCGYGTESFCATDRFRADTENCDRAYGCIAARYFDADYTLVSHSGRGLVRNYGDREALSEVAGTMIGRMDYLFDEDPGSHWDFASSPWHPDAVVVNLGTNDLSRGEKQPSCEQYVAGYLRMIGKIRAAYGPRVPILCVAPNNARLAEYVRAACARSEDSRVQAVVWLPGYLQEDCDLGAARHPNYAGQRKMAMMLIPYLAAATGWPLSDRPIE